jgi:hypothetical protein
MRTILILTVCSTACCAGSLLGTWRIDRARSWFAVPDHPQSLTVRIEPHAKGRVFTLDRLEADGRTTVSATSCTSMAHPTTFRISPVRARNRRGGRTNERSRSGESVRMASQYGAFGNQQRIQEN